MKGQVSIEYLFIVGLALLVVTPLMYYATAQSSDSFAVSQASQTAESIAQAADYIYTLGPNSMTRLWVNIPNSVNRTLITNRTVLISVSTSSGINDVFSNTKGNVTGSLPSLQGRYYLILNHTDQGVVNVTLSS